MTPIVINVAIINVDSLFIVVFSFVFGCKDTNKCEKKQINYEKKTNFFLRFAILFVPLHLESKNISYKDV